MPKELAHSGIDFIELTLDVIGVSAFGYNFKAMCGSSPVVDAMTLLLSPRSAFYLVGKAAIPMFNSWPLPRLVNECKAKEMLYHIGDDVIAAKLKSKRDVHRPVDLVDLMLDESAHVEHKVTAEEARTHVMTFMLAGHEVREPFFLDLTDEKCCRPRARLCLGSLLCSRSILTLKPWRVKKPAL